MIPHRWARGSGLLMSALSVCVSICFLKISVRHLLMCSKNPQKINLQTRVAHPTKEYKLTIPVHAWGEVQRSRSLTRVLRAGPGWSVCIKVTAVLQFALCRMCEHHTSHRQWCKYWQGESISNNWGKHVKQNRRTSCSEDSHEQRWYLPWWSEIPYCRTEGQCHLSKDLSKTDQEQV